MSEKERPTVKELDEAAAKVKLATKLIEASRATAQMMGVAPGVWILAVIDEASRLIITQKDAGKTTQESLDLVIGLLIETVGDMESNPRIGETEEPGITMRIIGLERREAFEEFQAPLDKLVDEALSKSGMKR
jgi:hypothetical protein